MKEITANEAEARFYNFLHTADLDDLAKMVSLFIEDGPIVVQDENGQSDTFENGERTKIPETSPWVRARAYSDDQKVSEDFDAAIWFEQATDEQIRDLAICGWGGDYPADAVAQYMAEHDNKVGGIFTYLDIVNRPKTTCGFECHIDTESAMEWLSANRPHLADEFRENEEIETKGALQDFSHAANGDHQET